VGFSSLPFYLGSEVVRGVCMGEREGGMRAKDPGYPFLLGERRASFRGLFLQRWAWPLGPPVPRGQSAAVTHEGRYLDLG